MEDILASIRRILSEDDQPDAPQQARAPAHHSPITTGENADDVLVLDPSMLVPDPDSTPQPEAEPVTEPEPVAEQETVTERATVTEPGPAPVAAMPPPAPMPPVPPMPSLTDLVAPEAAAAAAFSVGSLVRTLAAGRATQVHAGGPTIEDLVREEVRPLLKEWLDAHLPPLVERLVRAEIERVVGRVVP
jgi:cell pole-organizing protein PopZ